MVLTLPGTSPELSYTHHIFQDRLPPLRCGNWLVEGKAILFEAPESGERGRARLRPWASLSLPRHSQPSLRVLRPVEGSGGCEGAVRDPEGAGFWEAWGATSLSCLSLPP